MPDKVIDVEYYANRSMSTTKKVGQIYCGVIVRPSDGFTCLALARPDAKRRHMIQVGEIEAITIAGARYPLATPGERWRTRAQEIRLLVEGECEEWAVATITEHQRLAQPAPAPATPPAPSDAMPIAALAIMLLLAGWYLFA